MLHSTVAYFFVTTAVVKADEHSFLYTELVSQHLRMGFPYAVVIIKSPFTSTLSQSPIKYMFLHGTTGETVSSKFST